VSKFRCVCGEVIRVSGPIPNPNELLIISDADFAEFEEKTFIAPDELGVSFTRAYRCPASGHVWIFWNGLEDDPICYEPLTVTEQAKRLAGRANE
jgi:hypothetical protein